MIDFAGNLIFLKLGGSLITYKDQPMTAHIDILKRIMKEIFEARDLDPNLQLILGHGSGSFGHSTAQKYNTRNGVNNKHGWKGFYEVYSAARELNQLVYQIGQQSGLPLVPFPLSTNATVHNRSINNWNLAPLKEAMQQGLIPLVYGDVAFDDVLGGTILSTEEIFDHLTAEFHPSRILLGGIEPGIWRDYPINTTIIDEIRLTTWKPMTINLQGSGATDVTGGMKSKVESMLDIIQHNPACEITIFSGLEAGSVKNALSGNVIGTRIRN